MTLTIGESKHIQSVDINTYIANNPILKINSNYDALLELPAKTQFDYVSRMIVIPSNSFNLIGYQVIQETINVDPYSYLLGMSAYSNQPEGLSFSVMDKGNNMYLSPNRNTNSNNSTGEFNFNDPISSPTGWLLSPLAVSSKGQMQINITNLSPLSAIAQLCLKFAVPVNKKNQQRISIKGGN